MAAKAAKWPIDRDKLSTWLARAGNLRVAVIGDFCLDRYLVIDPVLAENSIETGLTAHQVVEIRNSPGAAGTVVNNLVSLGVREVRAIGVIGIDGHGFDLLREFNRLGVDTDGMVRHSGRFTATYTKPTLIESGGERELERFDVFDREPIDRDLEDCLIREAYAIVDSVDACVVLDQVTNEELGVVTDRVRDNLCRIAADHPKKLFYVDSRARLHRFRNMTVKSNLGEARLAAAKLSSEEKPLAADCDPGVAAEILQNHSGKLAFVTVGEKGSVVADGKKTIAVPTFNVEGPVDVTGAGDATSAGIVFSLLSGATPEQAAFIGNLAASVTVEKLGTTGTCSPRQLLFRFDDFVDAHSKTVGG